MALPVGGFCFTGFIVREEERMKRETRRRVKEELVAVATVKQENV
jgi:hypothetical protein